jgi:hypothetical protein
MDLEKDAMLFCAPCQLFRSFAPTMEFLPYLQRCQLCLTSITLRLLILLANYFWSYLWHQNPMLFLYQSFIEALHDGCRWDLSIFGTVLFCQIFTCLCIKFNLTLHVNDFDSSQKYVAYSKVQHFKRPRNIYTWNWSCG